jgi:hypothetical protein
MAITPSVDRSCRKGLCNLNTQVRISLHGIINSSYDQTIADNQLRYGRGNYHLKPSIAPPGLGDFTIFTKPS